MENENKSKETFEVTDKETAAAVLPSREEAQAQGLTPAELEKAEKRGMIAPQEDKAKKEADDKAKAEADAAGSDPDDKGTEEIDEKRAEGKSRSTIPDFTMTPEQEKVFLETFGAGTPARAMYFRMKNERQARQSEKQAREASEKKAAQLEEEIKALRAGKTPETDELGNPIDPEEKPLTLKELRAIQKAEAEAFEQKQKDNEARARTLADAQQTQEEYMQAQHADFDETVELVKDLIPNLEKLVPEKWKQTKILNKVRELQIAAAQADKIDLDEYHAAQIAYELGQMHPKYGKKAEPVKDGSPSENGKPNDPKKANGGRTPEQMKRIEDNTHRRASSASVQGGGGTRTISADDVDAATLNNFSYSERQKFKEKHPDQYAKLLRG